MVKYKLCVFSYSFKHKKSYDFINLLAKKNLIGLVIASPKEKLFIKSKWQPHLKNFKKKSIILSSKEICKKYKINYVELKHSNFIEINKICKKTKINIGVIAGARILKKNVIKIFKHGIINFHPGKIPETSGLDSFFWMLKKNANPYVTAHFIDKYVDRGRIIKKKKIPVKKNDDFFSLKNRIYNYERILLSEISEKLKLKKKIRSTLIKNYSKNEQLSTKDKKNIYEHKFLQFKKQRI